jgi:hypothetical protein
MPIHDPIEAKIAALLVDAILAAGHSVTIWEGGGYAIKRATDRAAILDALASTDSDCVNVFDASGKRLGEVLLIYGNGEDLISDHTDNDAIQALVDHASPPEQWD